MVHDAPEAGVGAIVLPARIELPHERLYAEGQLAVLHSLFSGDVSQTHEDLETAFCLDDNGQPGVLVLIHVHIWLPDPQAARVQAPARSEQVLARDTSAV